MTTEFDKDKLDDDLCAVLNKHIKTGFISKDGYLFFDDEDIVDDLNLHIKGLITLIKMTYA